MLTSINFIKKFIVMTHRSEYRSSHITLPKPVLVACHFALHNELGIMNSIQLVNRERISGSGFEDRNTFQSSNCFSMAGSFPCRM